MMGFFGVLQMSLWVSAVVNTPQRIVDVSQSSFKGFLLWLRYFEPLATSEERAILEHVHCRRVEGPVGPLARPVRPPRDLDEAVVEGEVVSQRILPTLRVLAVVREVVRDELVDLGQGAHLLRVAEDGHCCQGNVRVRGLLVPVALARWPRHRQLNSHPSW